MTASSAFDNNANAPASTTPTTEKREKQAARHDAHTHQAGEQNDQDDRVRSDNSRTYPR
jgi:hypothetical protein